MPSHTCDTWVMSQSLCCRTLSPRKKPVKSETVAVMHLTVEKHMGLKGEQFGQSVTALIQDECEASEARYWRCLLKSDIVEVNAKQSQEERCLSERRKLKEYCHYYVSTYTCGQELSRFPRRSEDEEAGREREWGGRPAQMNFDFQPPTEVWRGSDSPLDP